MSRPIEVDPQRLERLFAAYDRGDAPGLAVGLAVDGEPAFRRGFGLAGVEPARPLGPDTRLRIGSVSKHFLCMLLLLLAEEGRLSLDDSPRRQIPELPAWAEGISLRQLMSHSGGVRCSLDLILQTSGIGRPVPERAQLALMCAQTELNFQPGTGWCYSNGGYVLLSEVAERAGGRPLDELLRCRLFEPARMQDTLLYPYDSDGLSNAASLHLPAAGGAYRRCVFGPAIRGEGGIVSTVDDMLRWMAQMAAPVFGRPASWAALHTPLASNGYGLGLYTGEYRGVRIVHHAGHVIGGTCQMIRLPDCGLDLILIANSGDIDAGALALQAMEACVAGPEPKPACDDAAVPLSADFHSARSGSFVRLLADAGRQYGVIYAGRQRLHRIGPDGALSPERLGSDLRLVPVLACGAVTALDLHECGRVERLPRLPPPSALPDRRMNGRYRCHSLDVSAAIAEEDGRAVLSLNGPYGGMRYALEVLGSGLCLASTGDPLLPLGGLIELDDRGFLFSSQRTRRLRFARMP